MFGGMGNACASPPATPVHSLKSAVSNRAVQRRSDPTSSGPHPAASADPEDGRVPHGSRRQREDRRGSGDQLAGEGGERREARAGGMQADGETQADLDPRLRSRTGEIERPFGEQRRRDADLAVPFEARARDARAHASVDRQPPLPQPHAPHGVVDRQQRHHARFGTEPVATRRPAQLSSDLTDVILRSEPAHDRRAQIEAGARRLQVIDRELRCLGRRSLGDRRRYCRLRRQLGGIDCQRDEHRRDPCAVGAVTALISVLADLARREDPIRHAEIEELDERNFAACRRAEAGLQAFRRHQRDQLIPDGVGAWAGARPADHGRCVERRARCLLRRRGHRGIVGRCRARGRSPSGGQAEQRRGGQARAAKERFTHQATISESQPVGRDVGDVPRLQSPRHEGPGTSAP
jgi:hypothetical protein